MMSRRRVTLLLAHLLLLDWANCFVNQRTSNNDVLHLLQQDLYPRQSRGSIVSNSFRSDRGFASLTRLAAAFDSQESVQSKLDQAQNQALIKAKLSLSDDLIPLELVGKASLPTSSFNQNQTCLVLSLAKNEQETKAKANVETTLPALLVPVENDSQLRLVETAAAQNQTLSFTSLLRLNTLLVNRDNGIFDNLPWSTWTVDPSRRNYDAAGNAIDARYHMGKRDAYNVMLGKDWARRRGQSSQALSNLAQRLRERLQQEKKTADSTTTNVEQGPRSDDEENSKVLARRMLELRIREAQMDLAECDYQLAIARTMDETWALEDEREILASRVSSLQAQLEDLTRQSSSSSSESKDLFDQLLADVGSKPNKVNEEAPYWGATGYSPKTDKDEATVVLASPFHMLKAILKDQLKAEIIGTLLENTSLLQGTTALGGLVVLRRMTATKTATIAGEALTVSDETEDFGNAGVMGGEIFAVECDVDEALGMSFAYGLPLQVERGIWERSSLMVKGVTSDPSDQTLTKWQTVDPELSVLVDGQAGNQSATERVAPLRAPRSTASLFDSILQPRQSTSKDLFPSDNPIKSLNELDQLSNEDKARTLLSMSNFEGRVPRPRVVRESEQSGGQMNALDRLLIPLIDESVRREYYIRQAVNQGDLELAQELESSKSMRQIAKEKAQQARDSGDADVAEFWEKEADLYASLRADVTQDEGSYSRFLDRDEWYERERRRTAERTRKKFGNLFDGTQ